MKSTKTQELVYEMKVGEVMNKKIITVKPDTWMSELREILRINRISGTPVVVDDDSLVGIISIEDFIKWLNKRQEDCPIKEKMTRDVEALFEDDPLVEAIERMEKKGYGRFPVLDRSTGRLVGVITKGDVIEGILKKMEVHYHEEEELRRYRASHIFEDIKANRVMLTFEYDVVGRDFKKAGESSKGLKMTLNRLGLPPKMVRRVAIATYEAEMNLVIYAGGGNIVARVTPSKIVINVIDEGPGIPDIEKAMEPGYSTAPDWVRELGFGAGMGLVNIKNCSDEMSLDSTVGKGTHLKFSINLGEN